MLVVDQCRIEEERTVGSHQDLALPGKLETPDDQARVGVQQHVHVLPARNSAVQFNLHSRRIEAVHPLVIAGDVVGGAGRRVIADRKPAAWNPALLGRPGREKGTLRFRANFGDRLLLVGGGGGFDFPPIPWRGVKIAADVDQGPVRLGLQPTLEPIDDLGAGRLEVVGKPDNAVGLVQPRRERTPGRHAMPRRLEHLRKHGRAVDAFRGARPVPLPIDGL